MCSRLSLWMAILMVVGLVGGASAELVGHWGLDEGAGTVATDSSGYGNDGVLVGNPQWVTGKIARALYFDGDGDYVEIPHAEILTVDTEVSVAAWINAETLDPSGEGYAGIVAKSNSPRSYSLYTTSGGPLHFSTNGIGTNSVGSIPLNEWVHVVASVVDGAHEYYINGVLDNRTGSGVTLPGTADTANVLIGTTHEGAARVFQGMIDDVRIYNQALTLEELPEVMKGKLPWSAADPVPEDEATDVLRDAALAWEPGEFAQTHNVYFGTVWEDVNDGAGDTLVSEGQTEAAYDPPDVFDFGQTYYWRVDEVNGAPDYTVFKGDVWSFTAELFAYPIEGVIATSNMTSVGPDQALENMVNGSGLDENGQHSVETTDMWLATSDGEEPMYIQFEFDRIHKMHEMEVWNHNFLFEMALGMGIKDVTVEYSTDGTEWTTLTDAQLAQAPGVATYTANTTVPLDGVAAKFVRLLVHSNYGGGTQYGLSEIRFLSIPVHASEPSPADGAVDVPVDGTLNWRHGREAASHEVYLGTDPDALSMVGTATTPSFDAALDLDTTYAWQVVEVNEAEAITAWTGPVWSFTTQPYLLVDGFESYTDDVEAEETIWQTWIDGIDDSTKGGSTVGYDQSPFAEQTIVYAGDQSMPLRYDNADDGFSETTRTFATAQDWSLHGITTLTVRFKGALDAMATDRLYVKVNGTKVVYDGDLTSPIWLPFNVDLTSLGVNLSSVSTLTIGIDGTGSGTVFVDDIALYRIAPVDPATSEDKTLVAHWKFDETEGLTAADSSGYGNDGTLVGMEGTEWTTGINGGALAFAGGSSANPTYVNFGNSPSLQLNGSVTMSAWVKMNEGNDAAYMGIGGKLISGTYKGFALVRHSSNVFRLWANSTDNQLAGFEASSDETYTDTEWHHVVGVVDAGTSMLYVDGVKQAQEGNVDLVDSTTYAYIGKQYGDESSHRYWNGLIDDVRIYYRALSAQEVAGL